MNGNHRPSERSYPLGALFLLVAVCAVTLGLTALLLRDQGQLGNRWPQIIWSALLGSAVCAFLGLMVGQFHFSRLRGAGWGVFVGWLLGLFAGPLLLVPPAAFPLLLLTAFLGAAILIGTAVAVRLLSSPTPPRAVPPPRHDIPPAVKSAPRKPHPLDPDPDEDD
jgi:hypothetical protein